MRRIALVLFLAILCALFTTPAAHATPGVCGLSWGSLPKSAEHFTIDHYKWDEEIIAHLSPWAQDPGRAIAFGGLVYKSEVLDFVEERPYVDYLTDFRMYHLRGGARDTEDVNEARAATPDAILVSDETHDIAPVPA